MKKPKSPQDHSPPASHLLVSFTEQDSGRMHVVWDKFLVNYEEGASGVHQINTDLNLAAVLYLRLLSTFSGFTRSSAILWIPSDLCDEVGFPGVIRVRPSEFINMWTCLGRTLHRNVWCQWACEGKWFPPMSHTTQFFQESAQTSWRVFCTITRLATAR